MKLIGSHGARIRIIMTIFILSGVNISPLYIYIYNIYFTKNGFIGAEKRINKVMPELPD